MTGQGVFTNPNGSTCSGEFKDGVITGRGVFTKTDGARYVGEFKNGMMDGQGALTVPGGISTLVDIRIISFPAKGRRHVLMGRNMLAVSRRTITTVKGLLRGPVVANTSVSSRMERRMVAAK